MNGAPTLIPANSVLFSFKLSIGKTAIAGTPLYTNEAIAGLIPRDSRVLPEFLYYVLPHLDYRKYQQPATKGETLNKRSLAEVLVPVPSIEQQREIVLSMRDREEEIERLRNLAKVEEQVAKDYMESQILAV